MNMLDGEVDRDNKRFSIDTTSELFTTHTTKNSMLDFAFVSEN
jgi:hypothetical protein